MLIGVLCEVVSCTKQGEEERAVLELVREKIEAVMDKVDKDGSGMISRKEFDTMLEGPDAEIVLAALEEIDVESKHLLALSDSLFELDDDEVEALKKDYPGKSDAEIREEGKELSFSEFLKTLCHLRPENNASVMDVAEVRKMMRRALRKTEMKVEQFEGEIGKIEDHGLPHAHVEGVRRLLESTKEIRDKVLMEKQRAEANFKKKMAKLFNYLDVSRDGHISWAELEAKMDDCSEHEISSTGKCPHIPTRLKFIHSDLIVNTTILRGDLERAIQTLCSEGASYNG